MMLKFTQHIEKKIGLLLVVAIECASCSLVFSDALEQDAGLADADVGPTAHISIIEPSCDDNIYKVHGLNSASEDGTSLAGYNWEIFQGGVLLTSVGGEGTLPVSPAPNVLSGTVSQFEFRPSLFSAPSVMSVSGAAIGPAQSPNLVFQSDLSVTEGQYYSVSFVASSQTPRSFSLEIVLDDTPGTNLGFISNVGTSDMPRVVPFEFMANATTDNARLQMTFNTPGSFLLDNFDFRAVIGGDNQLRNSEIEGTLGGNWQSSFSTGAGSLVEMPRNFLDTRLSLKVLDSSGRESFAASKTIRRPNCI